MIARKMKVLVLWTIILLHFLGPIGQLFVCGDVYERKDVAFVLDCSKSISKGAFERSIGFLQNLVDFVSISPGTTRVALITFATKAKLEFNFEQYVNRQCIHRRFSTLIERRQGGRTNIDAALQKAVHLFKNHKGFAKDKEIYLISDGKWNEGKNPKGNLIKLKNLGVKIRVFAIGKKPSRRNLEKLASTPCKDCHMRLSANFEKQMKLIKKLTKRQESMVACKGSEIVKDECNRECTCVNGEMRDCFRVRREFTTFTKEEKKRYLGAYFRITTEEPLKSRFITFIKKHNRWFWKGIHSKGQFFPWHRWYVYQFENMMREVDCKITVPYWDWSYWRENVWKMGLHIWGDDMLSFGGDGLKEKEHCVQTGPFNASVWEHPAPEDVVSVLQNCDSLTGSCVLKEYGGSHPACLRRSFNSLPANLGHVLRTLETPCSDFASFDSIVRDDYHNDLHNEIGGVMSTDFAANAPEFFLHHAFLDNIWYRWQEKSPDCKSAFYKGNPNKLIDSPFDSNDFTDSLNQGECVKVIYDDFLEGLLKPGESGGEPRASTMPADSCPQSDSNSAESIPRSAYMMLRDSIRRERDNQPDI